MDVLHITRSLGGGGADRAARAIVECLPRGQVAAVLAVSEPETPPDPFESLAAYRSSRGKWFASRAGAWALWTQKSSNSVHRSINVIDSGALDWINDPRWDVVHLHWVGAETLSISNIGGITRPVVWTLHDSWVFCGAEHHPEDLNDERFVHGYTRESRPPGNTRFDLDAWVYRRKAHNWQSPFWLAAPSAFMAYQAGRAELSRTWPCEVIPNPVDVDVFTSDRSPNLRAVLLSRWGIPAKDDLIVFGATSSASFNKGWDLLQGALRSVSPSLAHCRLVVFGADHLDGANDLGLPVTFVGEVADRSALAQLISSARVVAVPSRIESFSLVSAEAQSCGTPVVAFDTTGVKDVIENGVTGELVDAYSTEAFGEALVRRVRDAESSARMGLAARARAVRLWSPDVIGRQYVSWYERAIAGETG